MSETDVLVSPFLVSLPGQGGPYSYLKQHLPRQLSRTKKQSVYSLGVVQEGLEPSSDNEIHDSNLGWPFPGIDLGWEQQFNTLLQ